ncbi:Gna1 Glucosamine-6-phosphate acetyltransferase [Candida orthopsilosis Co 90-125]|uniref:Glucosamine 6-phosphate N-acetyltransferase n=1 Tax=Candida orthopsilosis (strain 90-125) TaxID=1136231 RepID=H8WXE3_CANO9|nr:Gna1 Glucosamine-6-phosphate acetyltransferase [Candida orthopsilosis Co 90-125]CCG21449.1 Gna1 Glucosamine-6-phosphate acetyltransferase [Candida orthopsilosis Co 90-125]
MTQEEVRMSLPEGYSFRKLKSTDYSNNYIETLKVLTTVGDISQKQFDNLFTTWAKNPEIYQPHVIVNSSGTIVATGMLFIESKLIHECGKVGHIEDISVAASEQGKKLGNYLVRSLSLLAQNSGCYKVILDCSPHNVGFYEKCGYKNDGIEMVQRF